MSINLTKVLTQIQNRISDSTQSDRDLNKLIAAANRINNSGTQVLTYQSTGQLPSLADSNYIGVIARVASDNVFGDSDGRYYYASGTDSGWRGFKTTQDSADALIEAPASGGGAASATQAQGTAYGFSAGGDQPASSPAARNEIERFSFTSDGNATDYGDLTVVRGSYAAGVMSTTHGYAAGGYGTSNSNVIDKWPFASAANATDVGNLAIARYGMAGQMSETHGYAVGQANVPSGNYIDKWSLSVDGNASDIGDMTTPVRFYYMSASSSTTAYTMGGAPHTNEISKRPFASDGNNVAISGLTLTQPKYSGSGHNSDTHGYQAAGYTPPSSTRTQNIDKFPFAAEDAVSDVGDLSTPTINCYSSSSNLSGYTIGGGKPTLSNTIEKFSFTSDGNATDVGDLTAARWLGAQGNIAD